MAQWMDMPLDGGTVLTRSSHTLQEGEFQRATNVRYKRGDVMQLHRDLGHSEQATRLLLTPGGDSDNRGFTDMAYVGIEGQQDYIIGKRQERDEAVLYYAPASGVGSHFWRKLGSFNDDRPWLRDIEWSSDFFDVVHLGGQFLLGYGDRGTLITSPDNEDTFKQIGMKTPEEAWGQYMQERFENIAGSSSWRFPDEKQKIAFMRDIPGVNITLADLGNVYTPRSAVPQFEAATFFYWFTEYDSDSDVESQPYGIFTVTFYDEDSRPATNYFSAAQGLSTKEFNLLPKFDFSDYEPQNLRTTHIRLYRKFVGSYRMPFVLVLDTDGTYFNEVLRQYALIVADHAEWRFRAPTAPGGWIIKEFRGANFVEGALAKEFSIGEQPTGIDESGDEIYIDWVSGLNDGDGVPWEYYLGSYLQRSPDPWDMGIYYQGSVILNNLDEPTVLQYSVPGLPEYFPVVNQLPTITKGEDEILGLLRVGDYAMVLTRDNVHRINYLPGETDPPNEPLELVSTEGVVSRRAHCIVTLPQGVGLVWLSDSQLNLTTGSGSINVCEDFSVETAGIDEERLSDSILFNNSPAGRVELWAWADSEQVVYHFYYTREHVKAGGFKMLGPHTGLVDDDGEHVEVLGVVTGNSQQRSSRAWLFGPEGSYNTNVGLKQEEVHIKFPRLLGAGDPNTRIAIQKQGLYHTAILEELGADGKPVDFYMRYSFKSRNKPVTEGKRVYFTSLTEEEWDSNVVRGVSGNWVEPELIFVGKEDLSFGPMMLNMEVSSDGS